MPKKISNEVLQKAQELRTQEKSYGEISRTLNVSVSWCKHNLTSVLVQRKEVIAGLESKSKTRKGVSKGEITKAVNVNQSKKELIREVKNVTQQIRTRSKENIVRPNWMPPEFSMFTTNQVMLYANEMERRLQEYADEIRDTILDKCKTQEQKDSVPSALSLKFAIASLVCSMTNPSSAAGAILNNTTNSLYDTALKLEKRNGNPDVRVKVVKTPLPEGLEDLDEFAY
ncbi:MAG: hypothetical protein LC100_15340 [Chitinophagales bacterium]|nr:hypothetical protein [Chitinophagales bacterium]